MKLTSPRSFVGTACPSEYEYIEVTAFVDQKRLFIEGLPAPYREALNLWECHYCASLISKDLVKCPQCGGERR